MGSDREYYFISDLHIGGDAALNRCDFENELIDFLRGLEKKDSNTELIIIGDAFGLWELTTLEGEDKLRHIISTHRDLFDQFRRTGARITITVIPGNHDYELACGQGYARILGDYNIRLERKEYITRQVGGRKIWIEHGSQHDSYNAISDFGNPHVTPLGYFITRKVVSNAGKYSERGKESWLKDLPSVSPNERIPDWMLSNYFYREMSPFLRWILVPFLALFGASVVTFIGMLLNRAGVPGTEIFSRNFITSLGVFGRLYWIVFMVNSLIIAFLLVFSVPLFLVYRDVMKTLARYGLRGAEDLEDRKGREYMEAARRVFEGDPGVAVYIYGHTHEASLEEIDGRAVINTGTWLKKLTRIPARFKLLPDVYQASFRLNYFRIGSEGGRIIVDYVELPKETPRELTVLQRLVTAGRRHVGEKEIPARTVV